MRLKRDERGVTLIELLVAVTLLAIIIAPLTNAFIVFLRNTDATNERLAASHDAQIAAAYFAQDVQNVGVRDWTDEPYDLKDFSVEEGVSATGGVNPCGSSGTPNARLRLAWDDPAAVATGAPSKVVVSYYVDPQNQLHRLRCQGGGTKDIVVAHNLASAPVVTCYTLTGVAPSCNEAAVPQAIYMRLDIRVAGSTENILTVTLAGQRRQT